MSAEAQFVTDLVSRLSQQLPIHRASLLNEDSPTNLAAQERLSRYADALIKSSGRRANIIVQTLLDKISELGQVAASGDTESKASRRAQSELILLGIIERSLLAYIQDPSHVGDDGTLESLDTRLVENALDCCLGFLSRPSTAPEASELHTRAGACVYHLSMANFSTVFERGVCEHLRAISNGDIDESNDYSQLSIIKHLNLKATHLCRLLTVLIEYAPRLRKFEQTTMAAALRVGLLRWLETYPGEMVHLWESNQTLAGSPEVLFETINKWAYNWKRKNRFWPTMVLLLLCCPEVFSKFQPEFSTMKDKELKKAIPEPLQPTLGFLAGLAPSFKDSKVADVTVGVCIDICSVLCFLNPAQAVPLSAVLSTVRPKLEERLTNFNKPIAGDNDLHVRLLEDYLVSLYHSDHKSAMRKWFLPGLLDNVPIANNQAVIQALLSVSNRDRGPRFHTSLASVYHIVGKPLVRCLDLYIERRAKADAAVVQAITKNSGQSKIQKLQQDLNIIDEVLIKIFKLLQADPNIVLPRAHEGSSFLPDEDTEVDLLKVFNLMCSVFKDSAVDAVASEASQLLLVVHQAEHVTSWTDNVGSTVVEFLRMNGIVIQRLSELIMSWQNADRHTLGNLLTLLMDIIGLATKFLLSYEVVLRGDYIEWMTPQSNIRRSATGVGEDRERTTAMLELALLTTLTAADPSICSRAATCFGLVCDQVEALGEWDNPYNNFAKNFQLYSKLSTTGVLVTGRVAQQKSIRDVLRHTERPTTSNIGAGIEVLGRWNALTRHIMGDEGDASVLGNTPAQHRMSGRYRENPENKRFSLLVNDRRSTGASLTSQSASTDVRLDPERAKLVWQNYTGFLCAISGVCLSAGTIKPLTYAESPKTVLSGLTRGASPGPSGSVGGPDDRDDGTMVDTLVTEMMSLIVSDNAYVSDTVLSMIGSGFSPAAYPTLFRHLHAEVNKIVDDAGQFNISDQSSVFAVKAIGVVHRILEQAGEYSDYLALADFEKLVLSLVHYASQLVIGVTSVRMKLHLVRLITVLLEHRENINLQNEASFRTQLLHQVIEWTTYRSTPAQTSKEDLELLQKLYKALDSGCMQAISLLLVDLKLKDSEEDTTRFSKYFTFLSGQITKSKQRAERDPRQTQLLEFTIQALSHLLTANIELGLEYFATMGYEEDVSTRSAFLEVLTNILKHGVDIEGGGEEEVKDRYAPLRDLLLENISLVLNLMDVVSATDHFAQVLVRFYYAHDRPMDLIHAVITREVQGTDSPGTLFRGNTYGSKVLTAFSKLVGIDYLRATVKDLVLEVCKDPSGYEIDPGRLADSDDVDANVERLTSTCHNFLERLSTEFKSVPPYFHKVCNILQEVVARRFPTAKHSSVGGFLFLRFFNPAIVAPGSAGIVKETDLPSRARRSLVLISKTLQNVASGVMFGVKEQFMNPMNAFIEGHIESVRDFFDRVATIPEDCDAVIESHKSSTSLVSEATQEEDMMALHYYLANSVDKLASRVPSAESVPAHFSRRSTVSGPQEIVPNVFDVSSLSQAILEQTQAVLAEAGKPPEHAQPSRGRKGSDQQSKLSAAERFTSVVFEQFMKNYHSKHIVKLVEQRIFFQHGTSVLGRPVFYYVARRVNAETDRDLLLYLIMKTLQPFFGKQYDVVIDSAGVNSTNELPNSWFTKLFKLSPRGTTEDLMRVIVVTPSEGFKNTAKRLAKLFSSKSRRKLEIVGNRKQLKAVLYETGDGAETANTAAAGAGGAEEQTLPPDLNLVETEVKSTFSPAERILGSRQFENVVIQLSPNQLQIFTKGDTILGHKTTRCDVIKISNIFSALRTGKRDERGEEFSILYRDAGTRRALLLRSPLAVQIIQALTAAIRRLREDNKMVEQHRSNVNVRPFEMADVPGSLLNMSFLNLGSNNTSLRVAAHNMLTALCQNFNFSVSTGLQTASDLFIPRNCQHLVVQLSSALAQDEIHLTMEFLLDGLHGLHKASAQLKHHTLQYMSPWLPNIGKLLEMEGQTDKLEKATEFFRKLIELTVNEKEFFPSFISKIWDQLGASEKVISLALDVITSHSLEAAKKAGSFDPAVTGIMCDVAVTLAHQNGPLVTAKLTNRIMEILRMDSTENAQRSGSSLALDRQANWGELLLRYRFLVQLSFKNLRLVMQVLPEVMHFTTMLFKTGPNSIHSLFHSLLINVLHVLSIELGKGSSELQKGLQAILEEFSNSHYRIIFISSTTETYQGGSVPMLNVEKVSRLLLQTLELCSHADLEGLGDEWQGRWEKLVQEFALAPPSGSLNSRAWIVLGTITRGPVPPSLLAKIFTALPDALDKAASGGRAENAVAIITSLRLLYPRIDPRSPFYTHMPGLAIGLMQLSVPEVFLAAVKLLETVALDICDRAADNPSETHPSLEEAMWSMRNDKKGVIKGTIDQLSSHGGASFQTDFAFAITFYLLRGLADSHTKPASLQLLLTMARLSLRYQSVAATASGALTTPIPTGVGYLIALLPLSSEDLALSLKEKYANVIEAATRSAETDSEDAVGLSTPERVSTVSVDRGSAASAGQADGTPSSPAGGGAPEVQRTAALFSRKLFPVGSPSALLFVEMSLSLLRTFSSESEQLAVYRLLSEALNALPKTFRPLYELMMPHLASITRTSSNERIVDSVLELFNSWIDHSDQHKTTPSESSLLRAIGYSGIADLQSFDATPRPKRLKSLELCKKLISQIVESSG